LNGIVTSWNKAAEEMYGYSAGEILGRPIVLLLRPNLTVEEQQILDRLQRGERVDHFETVRRRKDGTEIHVSLSVSLIRNLAGEIIGVSKIARDITEQKLTRARLEEVQSELLHVARLSTIGQMASSLAHELNQPLAALRSYLAVLRRFAAAPALEREQIGEIAARADEQAARAGDVIRHVREFVAKGETERRLEDLNEVVEEAAALALVETEQNGIRTFMRLGRDLPPMLIDRVQIQQVIVNLVRNAAEAMESVQPQELTISTVRRLEERAVEIAVADTGPGIARDIVPRLFQPFVSGKRAGLGLGLSICREIAAAHGGRLSAAANAPMGTVFSLVLPLPDRDDGHGS
jgi:two-component system sensor kinase FixL